MSSPRSWTKKARLHWRTSAELTVLTDEQAKYSVFRPKGRISRTITGTESLFFNGGKCRPLVFVDNSAYVAQDSVRH
jgi:hypothetical protein